MLLGDLCTYVIINIINITVYLMLLLLTVFRIKDMFKAFKESFFVRALVIINFGIHFHFYTRHVYRFKISVIGLLDL